MRCSCFFIEFLNPKTSTNLVLLVKQKRKIFRSPALPFRPILFLKYLIIPNTHQGAKSYKKIITNTLTKHVIEKKYFSKRFFRFSRTANLGNSLLICHLKSYIPFIVSFIARFSNNFIQKHLDNRRNGTRV